MSDPASIAFDHIVALVLSGALTPAPISPGQAASERAIRLQQERQRLVSALVAAGVRIPFGAYAHELRQLAAAAGLSEIAPSCPAWAAGIHVAAQPENRA